MPVLIALIALLGAAGFIVYREWVTFPADDGSGGLAMSGNGVAALVIGAIGSLVLGVGLMALVFISARRGIDDEADLASHRIDGPSDSPED